MDMVLHRHGPLEGPQGGQTAPGLREKHCRRRERS